MSQGRSFWDRKFDSEEFVYGTEPNRFLVEQVPKYLAAGQRILTLGEGEGRNAVWLAEQGLDVTAVDYSRPALEKLRFLARHHGVEVRTYLSDVMDFDLGEKSWDAVVLLHMHLPPRKRRRLHGRMVDALCRGGLVLLEALSTDQLGRRSGGPDRRELLYYVETLRRDFSGLTTCRLEKEVRFIRAGEHRGKTSVINLVARK